MIKNIIKAIKNPKKILLYMIRLKLFRILSDIRFIKIEYRLTIGEKLDIKNPKSYNEKIQWLKLNDRNPKYTNFVDKYKVREHIKKTIGEEYLIPLLGVWDKYDDINFDSLPNEFVLKPNHTSGDYFICKDKSKINHKDLRKKVNYWLKRKYFWVHREWPYKNVKPKIICEKYIEDKPGSGLTDYKFYCFSGVPKVLLIATDRDKNTNFDYFDMEFNHLPFKRGKNNSSKEIEKPKNFDEMMKLSKTLSNGISHVRVDFYESNGKVYFGELTLYPASGNTKFEPSKFDYILGEWIDLSKSYRYKNN